MELLIVNFHYFRKEKPGNGIYPVSPNELLLQINELAKYYTFISQNELREFIATNSFPEKRFCLLTFDDGLKEQMDAYHLLKAKNIPAVFYVSTDPLEYHTALNVHKLHYIRSVTDDDYLYKNLDKTLKISSYHFNEEAISNQYRYDTEIAKKIKYFLNFVLSEQEKNNVINNTFLELVGEENSFAKKYYMDKDDIQELALNNSLGSHGSSHLPLATLPYQKAQKDIIHSLEYLKSITGKDIFSFSYPYGGKSAVSENLAEIFVSTEIKFALTMWRGINNANDMINKFFLKRIDTNDAPGGKLNSLDFT